jgi:hypothetical protein
MMVDLMILMFDLSILFIIIIEKVEIIYTIIISSINILIIISLLLRSALMYTIPDLSNEILNNIDISISNSIRNITFHDLETSYTQCDICISEFESEDEISVYPCNHIYHANCVEPWIQQNSCPSCREQIVQFEEV